MIPNTRLIRRTHIYVPPLICLAEDPLRIAGNLIGPLSFRLRRRDTHVKRVRPEQFYIRFIRGQLVRRNEDGLIRLSKIPESLLPEKWVVKTPPPAAAWAPPHVLVVDSCANSLA